MNMIKRFAGCIRQYKKDTILTPIYITMEVLMEVLIPLLMASLIDKGINQGNMKVIIQLGIILVLSAGVSLLFGYLAGNTAARAMSGFSANLRHDIFYKIQEFSFRNIDRFQAPSIVTRLTTDINNVQMSFMMIIRIAVRAPIMLILSLIMSFTINAKLAMIFLIVVPILGGGLYLIIKNVHPIFERVFRTYDRLNKAVQENLRGIRVVKSYVREEREKEKFGEISQTIYQDFTKAEKILAFNSPLMQFSIYTCILFISWFGAKLIVKHELTTGQLMSILSYTMQILFSLMMLSMVFVIITISRASAERIKELFEEPIDLKNGENPLYQVDDGGISFEGVSFSYTGDKQKFCLRNVNLSMKSGETIGIIGGTGSSKTSLVQLIPRLYDVTEGSVKIGGVDVRDYDVTTLRNEVAMVLQKNVLFSGTIRENLLWGCESASEYEIIRACKLAQADEFIRSFPEQYDTFIEQDGSNVSGGQKQRLCIARAILKQPKILIMDDSTSAVDTRTDAFIRKALREEIPNTTKIIIAQRISSIMDADMIVVMEGGGINAVGTHEELLRDNVIYQEVYYSQQKGGEENAAE
jgi:ATP-binding cassette, subfamily B, multidrug efflux pump